MLLDLAYFPILGKSLIFWMGIITFLLLITTATTGYLLSKGKMKNGRKVHITFATLTILSAIFHAILGIGSAL